MRVPSIPAWLPAPLTSWLDGREKKDALRDRPGLARKPSQTSCDVVTELVCSDCGDILQHHSRVCQPIRNSSFDDPPAERRLLNLGMKGHNMSMTSAKSLSAQRMRQLRQTSRNFKREAVRSLWNHTCLRYHRLLEFFLKHLKLGVGLAQSQFKAHHTRKQRCHSVFGLLEN